MNRRNFLKTGAASGLALGTAGCLSWLLGSDGDEENTEGNQDDAQDPGPAREGDQDQGNGSDQSENNTSENGQQDPQEDESMNDTDENQSENQSDDERQREPSEEDTEIDRDQYEDAQENEVSERPESDVDVSLEPVRSENGTVTVSVTVENVSDEAIDAVDVEIIYLNEAGSEIGSDLQAVRDLPAGSTKSFETSASPANLRGEPVSVDYNATPMDYVE